MYLLTHTKEEKEVTPQMKWTVGCDCNNEVKLRPKGHQNLNLFMLLCVQLR